MTFKIMFQLQHVLIKIYRVYREVSAKRVENVPCIDLNRNNQTYPSPKLNSCGDKDKRSFKESEFVRRVESMSGNSMACCDNRHVMEWLFTPVFSKSLDSCGGPQTWPPRSPDLTPPEYFLWGYLKSFVYKTKVETRPALLLPIFAAAEHIWNHPENIAEATQLLLMRAEKCTESKQDILNSYCDFVL
jgi:hypothetical protein